MFREDIPGRRGGMEKKKKEKLLAVAGISDKEGETWMRWFAIAQKGHE